MSDVEQQAIAAVDAFQDAWNAQDHERLAAALNYPHVRLWSGVFTQIDTPEEFAEISRRGQSQLEAEGWHHTTTASVEVVQEGPDKAHAALIESPLPRRRQRLSQVRHPLDHHQAGRPLGRQVPLQFSCFSLALTGC